MIDRDHKLPLARQAKAVGISRGSIYYRPRPVGEAGLRLMRRIDELHLEYPFAGSRMMRGLLRQECWQSAQVGQIRTREDYYYEELRGSSLRVLL